MDKIDEAREILKMLGMPKAQQADICCYVLLAMVGVRQNTTWADAENGWLRIWHGIRRSGLRSCLSI